MPRGNYRFCIDERIYASACKIEVTATGVLILTGCRASEVGGNFVYEHKPESCLPNLILAPGKWHSAYAASYIDGWPVAVEGEGEGPISFFREPQLAASRATAKTR
jgi:hypothetical protein